MADPSKDIRADVFLDANQSYAIIEGKRVPVRFDTEDLKGEVFANFDDKYRIVLIDCD